MICSGSRDLGAGNANSARSASVDCRNELSAFIDGMIGKLHSLSFKITTEENQASHKTSMGLFAFREFAKGTDVNSIIKGNFHQNGVIEDRS